MWRSRSEKHDCQVTLLNFIQDGAVFNGQCLMFNCSLSLALKIKQSSLILHDLIKCL